MFFSRDFVNQLRNLSTFPQNMYMNKLLESKITRAIVTVYHSTFDGPGVPAQGHTNYLHISCTLYHDRKI